MVESGRVKHSACLWLLTSEKPASEPGDRVRVRGLCSQPRHNGQSGIVVGCQESSQGGPRRCQVRLDCGAEMALKSCNLVLEAIDGRRGAGKGGGGGALMGGDLSSEQGVEIECAKDPVISACAMTL